MRGICYRHWYGAKMEQTTNTRPSVKIKGRRGSCMADVMWPSGKQALPCLHQKLFKVDENGLGYYYDSWTSESKQFTKHIEALRTTKLAIITIDQYDGDRPGGEGRFQSKDYVGVWTVKDVTIKNSGLHVRLGARVASAI
jgi:hypothetical protein